MKKIISVILCCSSLFGIPVQPFITDPGIIGDSTPIRRFQKPRDATYRIRGLEIPFCFWYNPKIWRAEKRSNELVEKIFFNSLIKLMWGSVIAEIISIPDEEIKSLVWDHAEQNFDDVEFQLNTTRIVNTLPVYCFQWTGYYSGNDQTKFIRGQQYVCYEYIYAHPTCTIRVATYCHVKDFKKLEGRMTDFLNGLSWCLKD